MNMVFSYGYCRWWNQRWHQHVPPSLVVSMAMAVRRCPTKHISQCSMSRATPDATEHRHQVTACSVSPQRPPGQQANKQQSTNTPTKLAVLMAMVMRRYVTTCIAWWRRSRALQEATGRHYRKSIMSDNIKGTWLQRFFCVFHCQNRRKGHGLMLRPLFLICLFIYGRASLAMKGKSDVPMEITFMDNGGNIFVLDEFIEQMNSYLWICAFEFIIRWIHVESI